MKSKIKEKKYLLLDIVSILKQIYKLLVILTLIGIPIGSFSIIKLLEFLS